MKMGEREKQGGYERERMKIKKEKGGQGRERVRWEG